jgi:hypothetical protein
MLAPTGEIALKDLIDIEALKKKDAQGVVKQWDNLAARNIFADLLEATPDLLNLYQQIFEITDDILQAWWFSDKESQPLWRLLLLPQNGGFQLQLISMNALLLRLTGSKRVEDPVFLPDLKKFSSLSYPLQAKMLGRFCSRCDSMTSLDYAATAQALPKKLLPFFTSWFLKVYLNSPFEFIYEEANINRVKAMDSFTEFHAKNPIALALDSFHFSAAYRAGYYEANMKPFIETLGKLLSPDYPSTSTTQESAVTTSSFKKAILLNLWLRDNAVYRCVDPMLGRFREEEIHGLLLGKQIKESKNQNLPSEWLKPSIHLHESLVNLITPEGLAEVKQELISLKLDFLFYPEVSLDLASQRCSLMRLARVQATTYGHPMTTGSPHMDYFIGGVLMDTDPYQYSERLILLPQLGISSTPPPMPQIVRSRPLDDDRVLILNQSTTSKLNPDLLKAWNQILKNSEGKASLELYPSLSVAHIQNHYMPLAHYFPDGDVTINPFISRELLINQIEEMDLYLDSYPFGGYNTLIEVLASGCPVVTLEGKSARNRFGAATLRLLGLPEFLIAHSFEEYIAIATRLIKEPLLRLEIRAQLQRQKVLDILCDKKVSAHFYAAVEWMCEQPLPEKNKTHAPVYIEAGEKPRILDYFTPFKNRSRHEANARTSL